MYSIPPQTNIGLVPLYITIPPRTKCVNLLREVQVMSIYTSEKYTKKREDNNPSFSLCHPDDLSFVSVKRVRLLAVSLDPVHLDFLRNGDADFGRLKATRCTRYVETLRIS